MRNALFSQVNCLYPLILKRLCSLRKLPQLAISELLLCAIVFAHMADEPVKYQTLRSIYFLHSTSIYAFSTSSCHVCSLQFSTFLFYIPKSMFRVVFQFYSSFGPPIPAICKLIRPNLVLFLLVGHVVPGNVPTQLIAQP